MTWLTLQLDPLKPVDSNYYINGLKNFRKLSFYDLIAFLKKPRQEPEHHIDIDELPGWCDSYAPGEKGARYATHFLNQSAKLGYRTIFTSQRRKRANINYRELTQLTFKSEKKCLCDKAKCEINCENLDLCHFLYRVVDSDNDDEEVFTGKKITIPFRLAFDQVFLRYDTWEAVPPIGLDDVLEDMAKYDPVQFNAVINEKVRILREVFPNVRLSSIAQTEDLLLESGESIKFAGIVHARYNRLQQRTLQPTPKTATPNIKVEMPRPDYIQKWIVSRNQK